MMTNKNWVRMSLIFLVNTKSSLRLKTTLLSNSKNDYTQRYCTRVTPWLIAFYLEKNTQEVMVKWETLWFIFHETWLVLISFRCFNFYFYNSYETHLHFHQLLQHDCVYMARVIISINYLRTGSKSKIRITIIECDLIA